MEEEFFIEAIKKHVSLTDTEVSIIVRSKERRQFKKGQYLVYNGALVRKTFFILSGIVVAYFIDTKGEEHLVQFALKGWWISDIHSYLKGTPALLNVKAIENVVAYEFTYENMAELYTYVPAFQTYMLNLTQNAFVSFQQRVLDNISLTAEERYNNFCEKYPDINQSLSQKWIASYLGFTPEFLSRLKKKLLKA